MYENLKYRVTGDTPSLARSQTSLALPDPLRTGAYRLEIISAALRGSGTIHRPKTNKDLQVLLAVDWNPFRKVLNSLGVDC